MMRASQAGHWSGYLARPEILGREPEAIPSPNQLTKWWERFCSEFKRIVPTPHENAIKLAGYPSDTPKRMGISRPLSSSSKQVATITLLSTHNNLTTAPAFTA